MFPSTRTAWGRRGFAARTTSQPTRFSLTDARRQRRAVGSVRIRGSSSFHRSFVSGVVLWDVDTQVDFVLPEGKLYVPGAEKVAPAMRRLVEWARAAGIP